MTYNQVVEIIQNKKRFGNASGREVTQELMERLGFPERGMKVIHIAGTNGKGSTAAFASSILQAAGFVVGRFTSPHLACFRERIVVDGKMIPEADVLRLGSFLLEIAEHIKLEPTMFDYCLAMAILYFKERGCDYVVLETGLGGAKDSTSGLNLVPVASGFTNIGLDHTAILGDTIEQIAAEKAGILKEGTTAVVGIMDERAQKVICARAADKNIPVKFVDNLLTRLSTYEIPLNGGFQRGNAALAMALVGVVYQQQCGQLLDKLEEDSTKIDRLFRQGIKSTKWPGRMEVISTEPLMIIDGAHNPQGVDALFNSLVEAYPGQKFILLVGVMADKDYLTMMETMFPIAEEFICVTVENARALQGSQLAEQISARGVKATSYEDLGQALKVAKEKAISKARIGEDNQNQANKKAAGGCPVVIFGSLYFVGAVKELLEK